MSFLVAQPAPDFTAQAVMPDDSFAELTLSSYKGQYVVLFFWPLDFTFVCPSEIIAYSNMVADFTARGCAMIGVSVDSQYTHWAWRQTPVNKGGIGPVAFPMVADLDKSIARDYGVLLDEKVALRGTFLLDQAGVVRHATVNDLPLGRNIEETLRMVDALKFFEENGEVCPANWAKGKAGMKPTAEGVAAYLSSAAG